MSRKGEWCILRCAGGSTVRLAAALQEAGFDAWTPMERTARRVRGGKAKERMVAAMTPTYVFVRDRHLTELRLLEQAGFTNYPRFSIFRYNQAVVFVHHAALHLMRKREQESYVASLPSNGTYYAKARGTPLGVGDQVTFNDGPLTGLPCSVRSSDGRTTSLALTLFGRISEVKVRTSQLRADGVATLASAA